MTGIDALTVILAVAGSCAAALIGWLLSARRRGGSGPEPDPPKRWRSAVTAFIVLGAIACAIAVPVIAVLWALVALNQLLGQRENIPFSTYSMFSKPSTTAWAVRFEDSGGDVIAIGKIGLAPHIMRKRFAAELRSARRRGVDDVDAARRCAAATLATLVEEHRPPGGPLARSPITIVLMEYTLESGQLLTIRTPILETTPR